MLKELPRSDTSATTALPSTRTCQFFRVNPGGIKIAVPPDQLPCRVRMAWVSAIWSPGICWWTVSFWDPDHLVSWMHSGPCLRSLLHFLILVFLRTFRTTPTIEVPRMETCFKHRFQTTSVNWRDWHTICKGIRRQGTACKSLNSSLIERHTRKSVQLHGRALLLKGLRSPLCCRAVNLQMTSLTSCCVAKEPMVHLYYQGGSHRGDHRKDLS